ncbi:MAG: ABC transporter permease [Gemmatimonadales bacterium]
MDWVFQDIKFALRFLRKRWGVTGVAILVLGLGISLTASMYAIIKGVVLSGPDYPELDRIVFVRTTIPQSQFNQSVRIHDYLDWREQQSVFKEMAAYFTTAANLSGDNQRAEQYRGVRLTASTFALLGTQAILGRTFAPDEDLVVAEPKVILGYHVWEQRYDRDPDIVGKTIRVNARATTVVGVMPRGFRFPEEHDLWMPLATDPTSLDRRGGPGLSVLGRLEDNVTEGQAAVQLTAIARRLEQQYPQANKDIVPVVELWRDAQFVDDDTKGLLYTMFAAVVGVLLIACANVANLLFSMTMVRTRELAVRTALGAVRRRVLQQLLTETLVLAFGGAALGLMLSKLSLDLFTRVVAPLRPPPWMEFVLSPSVFLFILGTTFFVALASGILPALHATKVDANSVLQDQSRGSSSGNVGRWSTILVALEVALSCALLIGAGLTMRSTLEVGDSDFGLDRRNILTADLELPGATYDDSTSRQQVTDRLQRELEIIPGASKVAIASALPVLGTSLRFYGSSDNDYADDGDYPFGAFTRVTPAFFDVLGVPILTGRNFESTDALGTQPVVIVDQRFVDRNWPGEDAIGKQVRLGRSTSKNPWLTVVGVVRSFDMTEPLQFGGSSPEGMYVPIAQQPVSGLSVMLKMRGDPLNAASQLRTIVANVDPDIPVNQVNTLDKRIRDASLDFVIIGGMFATFGVVALILASIGLYAVMASSVSRRRSEVGIRMALGANGGRIIGLILQQGVKPVGVGMVVGLGLAVLLGKSLSTFLFNVSFVDPLTFVGIPLLLAGVSIAALLVPANRAARVAPVVALRAD